MKKLRFNREKLDFDEERISVKKVINKIVFLLFGSVLVGLVYYLLSALFFSSKEERMMQAETRAIIAEYESLNQKVSQLEDIVSNLQDREKEIYYALFNSSPTSFYTSQDTTLLQIIDTLDYSSIVAYAAGKLDRIDSIFKYNSNFLETVDTVIAKKANLNTIPSIVPIRDFSTLQTGATIGKKIHPFYKDLYDHQGLDIISAEGAEVIATADGVVVSAVKSKKGLGNMVSIKHEGGYVTNYCHLGSILTRKGRKVKKGDLIGRVGITGNSFAPHLHYEVHYQDKVMNPIDFFFQDLKPKEYMDMMMIAINTGQALD